MNATTLFEVSSNLPVLQLTGLKFTRPVFILSAPRSGSSYFYEVVRRMKSVFSYAYENDPIWHHFFPYRRLDCPTDYIAKSELTPEKIRQVKLAFFLKYLNRPNYLNRSDLFKKVLLDGLLLQKPIHYVEKTVANCFHLDILQEIFPDALFIHLVRDGRDCVSSMIEGWNSGQFSKRKLPYDGPMEISHWCYPIPPNWETVISKPLEEICAWSWLQHNEYVLKKIHTDQSFASRCLQLKFEDFLADPMHQTKSIATFLQLEISQETLVFIEKKQLSWSTVTAPKKEKWKEINQTRIENILPLILPQMNQLGYKLS